MGLRKSFRSSSTRIDSSLVFVGGVTTILHRRYKERKIVKSPSIAADADVFDITVNVISREGSVEQLNRSAPSESDMVYSRNVFKGNFRPNGTIILSDRSSTRRPC